MTRGADLPDPLTVRLADIVGPDHVLTDPATMAPHLTDWTRRWTGTAHCVVRPADTAETAAVVRTCIEAGAAIVPQGGNTGLVGGSVPRSGFADQVVLSTTRLDRLEAVDEDAAQVTVGAGVTLAELQRHAAAAGFAYGVDHAAREVGTIGGAVATNAGGLHVVRHGGTRQQVMGLEAVLPDGSVVRRLSGLVKDNVGYDLPGLLVGSEGTLGVVTRVRVRLVPADRHRVVALLAIGGLAAGVSLFRRLRAQVDGISAIEYVQDEGVRLVVERTGAPRPFARSFPAYLVVEVAGRVDPTPGLAAAVTDAPEVLDAAVATDVAGRAALWRIREGHTEAIATLGVAHKLDVTLPLGALAAFGSRLPAVVERAAPGAHTVVFGHLGDGNLHVNVVGPAATDDAVDAAVFSLVAEHGGSISAEHGVGVAKVAHTPLTREAADLAAMRAIKQAFDPGWLFNPGVLLAPPT